MEKFREYEEVLRMRYIHLYGSNDCEAWIKRERNKMLVQIILLFLVMGCLIWNDIAASNNEYSNVRVNEKGEMISVIRPEEGEGSYSFTACVSVWSSGRPIEKEYYITIEPAGQPEGKSQDVLLEESVEKDKVESQLKKLISGLNEDTGENEILLPQHLENGDRIVWNKADNTDPLIYIICILAVIWIVYRNRFHSIAKEEKKAKESIIKELPEFINKLVLLINAGVILNTAFLKIVDDCDEKKVQKSYFYRRICDIGYMVKETNASFHKEMYTFAKHSGVKELMRITNIMMDNISKGDDLSDKLRRENELLWFARKQQAEEKGRLAETKLTLPLMILLTVLIVVTISPALMEI